MERTMTIKKFFAHASCLRQLRFRDARQRLTMVLMLVMLTTATAWAGDTKILYDNSTEAKAAAGGLLNFYRNEACNKIISVNTDNNVSSGSMVYIKARPDGIHKFGATDDNNLVSFIRVEVVTPNNDGDVLPVSKFADGIYTFTMPSDASLHVSVTASFPERSTNADALTYIDEDGVEQTKAAGTVYVLDGSEFTLGVDDQEIWYIAQGTDLAYTHTLSYYGNTHLILEDGAAMSVTASGYDDGFYATGNSSLTICGQGGETEGSLTVRGYDGIEAGGNVIICSGIIDIASNSEGDGISASNITICGGQVTATGGSSGSSYGLYAETITLGWHKNTDRIMATGRNYAGYSTDVNIATDQRFVAFNAPTGTAASAIVSGTVSDQSTIAGKTLKPLDGNYIEATSGLQIGSLNGKDFTVRDADFSIDYAHYYLFSAAAEDVVVYYSNEYLPSDYHSIVWNVTGTSLKAYNYFGSGPRNMDNRYATFDMPGNADVTIDYENGGDGRMYQMPGGPLGSDSYWELSEDGSVLILDGTGDITVEKVDEWVNYNIKSISFSESVHYINNEVFAGLTHLETVSIGKNVERIGNGVFSGCTSLTSVTFPLLEYPSAINIGNGVFAGCTSLTSVTFQDTKVPTIGTDVFPENLTTIIVPAAALQSYYNAESWANYNTLLVASGSCGKTESDHVTWTLTRLATDFEVATAWEDVEPYNPTATMTVPTYKLTISGTGAMADYDGEGVTTPWAAADFHFPAGEWQDSYSDKSVITELEIGAGITALGANAFTGLRNLTSLTIADGSALTTIAPEDFAFPKTTLTLPDEVTTIDLKNDPAMLRWLIDSEIWRAYRDRFSTVGGYCGTTANNADGKNLEWTLTASDEPDSKGFYPFTLTITGEGAMADYGDSYDTQAPWHDFPNVLLLSDGLTTIGNYAFYWCGLSGTLDIPASVTSIGNYAFYWCGLSAVNIPGAKDTEGNALTTIGSSAFEHCESLATVTLGDGIKTIEGGAFQSTCLTAVTIPASVERIDYVAFATGESLKTVTMLGNNPPTLGESTYGSGPFPSSTSLSVILVPNETAYAAYMSAPTWNGTATGDGYNKNDYTHLLAPATITMGGNTSGWSTYCHKYIVSYQVEDGAAYTVSSVSDNTVQTAAAEHVAPYTPTLVYKENGGVVTLTAIAETATQDVPDNYNATTGLVTKAETGFSMLGVATDDPVSNSITEGYSYALFDGEFLKIDDSTLDIPAHRCILTLPEPLSAPRLHININGEATSLSEAKEDSSLFTLHSSLSGWYTLDGRKLDKQPTTKGLYIYKGKKVVIK